MSNTVLDRAGVKAKFDVFPEQIIDYLALVGDSSDNIPGIDKVGPKTAAKWLNKYGTLDALLAHAAEIEGKVGDNLRAGLTTLALSRQLATIRTDLALPLDEAGLVRRAADIARLRALYRRLELRTLLQQLEAAAAAGAAASPVPQPMRCRGWRPDRAERRRGRDAADALIELATPADPARGGAGERAAALRDRDGLGCADALDRRAARARAVRVRHRDHQSRLHERPRSSACRSASSPAMPPTCRWRTTMPARRRSSIARGCSRRCGRCWRTRAHGKLGQHLKFDMHVLAELRHHSCAGSATTPCSSPTCSTAPRRATTWTRWPRTIWACAPFTSRMSPARAPSRSAFNQVSVERAAEYAAEDADVTLRLHRVLWPRLRADAGTGARCTSEIEQPLVPVLQRMERHGVLIDRAMLHAQSGEIALRLREIEAAGASRSRRAVQSRVAQAAAADPVRAAAAAGAAQDPERHAVHRRGRARGAGRPTIRCRGMILEYRGLAKLRSTYTEKLPEQINRDTGRVHTSYHQAVAATGRLSSTDPESAEHSDPQSRGPPHPPGVHRPARPSAAGGRLLADRTAHHGAPVGR